MATQFKVRSPLVRNTGVPIHLPGEEREISSYVADFSPQITGYIFAVFSSFSTALLESFFQTDTQISLATLSRGYTLPSISVNENTFSHYGNNPLPGKINIGSDLSIRFIDTADNVLMDFFKYWFSLVRPMTKEHYEKHRQMTSKISGPVYQLKYYGSVIIFSTDPSTGAVTDAVGAIDVYPSSYPVDILNVEIENNSLFSFTQNFKIRKFLPRTPNLINFVENNYLRMYEQLDKVVLNQY